MEEIDFSKMGGVIIEEKETDYLAGTIPYELVCEDFTPYLPNPEKQHSVYFDSSACVTFSATNVIETQLNYFLATGKISENNVRELTELGYIVDGQFNFSDRFTAKMSGTTTQGNTFQNVWDSIRHDGLLPEKDWDYPRDQRTPVFDWDDYYKEIPQELKDKAKKILDYISISYETVLPRNVVTMTDEEVEMFKREMKQAPLQYATPVCNWNKTPCTPCGRYQSQHATMGYKITDNFLIEDHYDPFLKQLSRDYIICYAQKAVVTLINNYKQMKLIRERGRKETYIVINGKNYYIRNTDTFNDLNAEKLADWGNVEEVDTPVEINGVIAG